MSEKFDYSEICTESYNTQTCPKCIHFEEIDRVPDESTLIFKCRIYNTVKFEEYYV